MPRGKREKRRGIAAHNPEYFVRKFNGEEFVSILNVDEFKSKPEADKYAEKWRSGGYRARVTKEKAGHRLWINNPREKKRRRR